MFVISCFTILKILSPSGKFVKVWKIEIKIWHHRNVGVFILQNHGPPAFIFLRYVTVSHLKTFGILNDTVVTTILYWIRL